MAIVTKNFADLRKEVEAHVAADTIEQGEYWEGGKGCFIGCLAHGNRPEKNLKRFGLPIALQRIAESIFESLPADKAKEFFAALPDAVERDGKDLSLVHWQFLELELKAIPKQKAEIQEVIDPVIAGMSLLAEGKEWTTRAADAAADAADAAARAAYAAYAANAAARLRQRDTLLRLIKEAN